MQTLNIECSKRFVRPNIMQELFVAVCFRGNWGDLETVSESRKETERERGRERKTEGHVNVLLLYILKP